ncbi:hypothetical protein [Nostoc sp. FACHB-892]|uniref:hypothetical protein n=1 Tax=Nostoc sp. FACHB-892 TaxID=2692843 RepID=UPI001F55A4BC|nr:hypothetical protein [Nostoc sp. FACHB-892]
MTQPNLLELAKQGDAQAIASLMNRQLQPKGITAKVALKDACDNARICPSTKSASLGCISP